MWGGSQDAAAGLEVRFAVLAQHHALEGGIHKESD